MLSLFPSVVAFLVALYQNKQLIGRNGLLPAQLYLEQVRNSFQSSNSSMFPWQLVGAVPTIFWWIPESHIDVGLDAMATIGLILSGTLIVVGGGNAIIFFVLWLLYQSISNVGQRW